MDEFSLVVPEEFFEEVAEIFDEYDGDDLDVFVKPKSMGLDAQSVMQIASVIAGSISLVCTSIQGIDALSNLISKARDKYGDVSLKLVRSDNHQEVAVNDDIIAFLEEYKKQKRK